MGLASADDFDTWYVEARPRVLAALVLTFGDLDVASDSTDEAFVRALSHWARVRRMASPLGWTLRVGMNVARRRERRRGLEERTLHRHLPETLVPAPAGEAWLLVRELPPRQRQVVVLRYVADLTEAEISRVLGVSRSAVSSALTDARRRLGEELSYLEVQDG